MASLAVITIQALDKFEREKKQRIYTINYMLDVAFRILSSELILKKHTIIPHIEATKRIINGDNALLEKALLADEFDILKAGPMRFEHLPTDYKLLVGYDNIEIVQMFDTLLFLHEQDANRVHLNEFVKIHLKSIGSFLSKNSGEREDVLNTYWDLLSSIEHESNRVLIFIVGILSPKFTSYINSWQFILFKTAGPKNRLREISALAEKNHELIPDEGYMEKVRHGGIQNAL